MAFSNMVNATLNFISPTSKFNRRYFAPGAEVNTGVYEEHTVTINDARNKRDEFTLDTAGFTLVNHTSSVRPSCCLIVGPGLA
jgi:hypothetical protein